MRFICTEISPDTNQLYRKDSINQSVIPDGVNLLTKSNKVSTKDGTNYAYICDTLREVLFSSFVYDGLSYSPSAWLTARGITGNDHTGITEVFDYRNYSCADIQNSYFYTIIAEDGIHFALPVRISSSKEIKSFVVISEINNYETDFSYQNETGYMYTLGESSKDNVRPILIDSTLKSHRINKYKSLQNVLTIQSGTNANPLDYIQNNGNYYILISRAEVKTDLYIYTCVKEHTETNTISGTTTNNMLIRQPDYSTTLGSPGTTITLSNLTMAGMKFRMLFEYKQASIGYMALYVNGDTTATNYFSLVRAESGAATNDANCMYNPTTNVSGTAEMLMSINPISGLLQVFINACLSTTSDLYKFFPSVLVSKGTLTDVTSISIVGAGNFSLGTKLTIQRVY